MRSAGVRALLLTAGMLVGGCGALEPRLPAAAPAIPTEWPLPDTFNICYSCIDCKIEVNKND